MTAAPDSTTYPGGKNGAGVYQTIINQIPPHKIYIEPFAGSAAIFRKKARADTSILIDKGFRPLPNWQSDPTVERIEGCAIDYLQNLRCAPASTFIYCDPPYVRSSRQYSRRIYDHEMTDLQHRQLLRCLRSLPCMVMISGYSSEIYDRALSSWRVVTFRAKTRGRMATEYLWMNYPEPVALHDYRYLGNDYRERERIKRIAERWVSRFERLPELERRRILSEFLARPYLAPLFSSGSAAGDIAESDDSRPTSATSEMPVKIPPLLKAMEG